MQRNKFRKKIFPTNTKRKRRFEKDRQCQNIMLVIERNLDITARGDVCVVSINDLSFLLYISTKYIVCLNIFIFAFFVVLLD